MRTKINLMMMVFLMLVFPAFAQTGGRITVSGRVLDEQGLPVIGAGVMQEGTTTGAATDMNGHYSITVPSDAVLTVQCIGYQTAKIPVQGRTRIDIALTSDQEMLEETVVVGYGTQKKANLTGAVESVGEETFDGRPNANLAQMLQGRVANLNLKFTDGRPNSSPSFNIRGKTSIGQGGSALVLIDGVEGSASLLNPNDIESVSVLKDAASSAIYGSRAPYGVVLITTKSAKKGTATVNYQANLSFETPTAMPDVISDGYTWAEHFYLSWYNYKGSNPTAINKTMEFSTAWLEEYRQRAETGNYEILVSDGSLGTKGRWLYFPKGVDYYDALYKDFTFTQTHNLSVSGADDKFDYYVSARLYDNDGLFDSQVNPDSYKMYNGRVKVGYQVTDWLKVTSNTSIAYSKYVMPETQSEGNGNIWRNIADEGHPCSPILNPDGTLSYSGVYSVGDILYGTSNRKYTNRQAENTIGAKATFLDNRLRFNADFTYRARAYDTHVHRLPTPFSRYEGVIESLAEIKGLADYISETLRSYDYVATNEYAEFEDGIGRHNFKFLLGYNYERQTYKSTYAYNDGLLSPNVDNINLALGLDNKAIEGDYSKWRTAGAFFRFNYNFDERYMLEFTVRRDGSARFGPGHKWATFPAVSAGWNVTNEPWFRDGRPDWINQLKLRASWGRNGNENIGNFRYASLMDTGQEYYFGIGSAAYGNMYSGASPAALANPTIRWEESEQVDVGFDARLFNDRLSFGYDFYNKRTNGMLMDKPIPSYVGQGAPMSNLGDMRNWGHEFELGWQHQVGGFHYSINANASLLRNRLINLGNESGEAVYQSNGASGIGDYVKGSNGEVWPYFYGMKTDGIFQNWDEIFAYKNKDGGLMQPNAQPGDVRFVDFNKDGYVNDDDRTKIGKGMPDWTAGLTMTADWKGFDAALFFQGSFGNQIFDYCMRGDIPAQNRPGWVLDRWIGEGTSNKIPRMTNANPNQNWRSSDLWVKDGSFVRLKTAQLGYTLPAKLLKTIFIKNFRVYVAGENLLTFTKYEGFDPEMASDGYTTIGVDRGIYPQARTITVGASITF